MVSLRYDPVTNEADLGPVDLDHESDRIAQLAQAAAMRGGHYATAYGCVVVDALRRAATVHAEGEEGATCRDQARCFLQVARQLAHAAAWHPFGTGTPEWRRVAWEVDAVEAAYTLQHGLSVDDDGWRAFQSIGDAERREREGRYGPGCDGR